MTSTASASTASASVAAASNGAPSAAASTASASASIASKPKPSRFAKYGKVRAALLESLAAILEDYTASRAGEVAGLLFTFAESRPVKPDLSDMDKDDRADALDAHREAEKLHRNALREVYDLARANGFAVEERVGGSSNGATASIRLTSSIRFKGVKARRLA